MAERKAEIAGTLCGPDSKCGEEKQRNKYRIMINVHWLGA